MGTPAERTIRILKISNSVKATMAENKAVAEIKLIAECCLEWGCQKRTVMDYLNVLEENAWIVRQDGKIWTKEKFDSLEKTRQHLEAAAHQIENGGKE